MKTQTHTPGPWYTNGVLIMNEKGSTVGRVGHIENYEANANLIAAAPDMLKALKMAKDETDGWGHYVTVAIAKAEGRI